MRVGGYEVEDEIGRGGFGVVFRARRDDGRAVALKLLSPLRARADSLARFERERRLLSVFGEREGFVPLLDAGSGPSGVFLVMPLVDGGTLRERLRGPLGVEETIALGRALAAALGRAHERGIVHRDLKPENVLFAKDSRPLVADLGLAKHFVADAPDAGESLALSRSGEARGTFGYAAREQVQDARSARPPADVFSLGAILYECLAGVPAFRGGSVIEVAAAVDMGDFEPLARLRPDAPSWLVRAIERALARSPEDRFPDGAAFERALAAGASSARRPLLVPLALVSFLAVALLGLLLLFKEGKEAAPAPPPPPVPSAPSSKRVSKAVELEERADALLGKQDFDGTIDLATRALELDSKLKRAWVNRAFARFRKGDARGSVADYTRALALEPHDDAVPLNGRGNALAALGELAGARADYDRAIELDPKFATAWANRGNVRKMMQDVEGSLADYTRAVELDPKNRFAWHGRGSVRATKRDLDGAIDDLTRAIALDPSVIDCWCIRATARYQKGDLDGSLDDLNRAHAIAPEDVDVLSDRALVLEKRGEIDAAKADLRRCLEIAPDGKEAAWIREWLAKHGD